MVSHHFNMFGVHWSGATGDKKYLICHVISQDQVIEGSPKLLVVCHHSVKFVSHRHYGHDHVTLEPYVFMGRSHTR